MSTNEYPLHRDDPPGFGRTSRRTQLAGRVFTWLAGGALALNIVMISGLLILLAYMGMGYFWPKTIQQYELTDGTRLWGELHDRETIRDLARGSEADGESMRISVRQATREVYGSEDFRWIPESEIANTSRPDDLVALERRSNGVFYGRLIGLTKDGTTVDATGDALWYDFEEEIEAKFREGEAIDDFEHDEIAGPTDALVRAKRDRDRLLMNQANGDDVRERLSTLDQEIERLNRRGEELSTELRSKREEWERSTATFETATGAEITLPVATILDALRPNRAGFFEKLGIYVSHLWGFIWDAPRESNTEGGIFPAIFGTVLMVFLMTFAVTPLGVLAALYLREYAKEGFVVRVVRIAVNNLAGVPSIVFGLFGLGFFVYLIGGSLDSLLFSDSLPNPTFGTGGVLWAALTLALLTVPVVIVATEEGLAAVPKIVRQGSLALGATKFETTWKVVLPAAGPGILTGVILAIARAAGEVAPLMIVGMVKLADVPVDGEFPFLHLERKFMHLGFHIYDVGFQSPNVDATKPLVYATALLLVLLVTAMNLVAIAVRNHLRRKYASSAV
ncbi:MAG: phosphate ABC transporter permease PstA [Planctomycetes bacterium]|nr:phosphate ABC transporter permease PstA [Planctomycetota bacterium]